MASASIFKNFVHLVEHKSLLVITKAIKEGNYKEEVEAIRKLIADGQDKEADKLKKQLLAFTPSGTFENGRKAELLSQYSEFVILDLDKLSPVQIEEGKKLVALEPYTYAAFISPSGNGLKIIVPVNSGGEHHKIAFQQVCDYYQKALQLEVDPSGKDVSRLCFMSYDPNSFRNIYAEKFNVNIELQQPKPPLKEKQAKTEEPKTEQPKTEQPPNEENSDWLEVFGNCIDFTDRKLNYHEGNRNNYLHLLACNCNRAGIPENIAQGYILQQFDLDTQEAIPTIHSAYANNVADFAKFADFAKSTENANQSKEHFLMNMPMLPDDVYDRLPEILKQGAAVFEDRRERDVFLTGALSIISGCMRNVVGLYRAKEHYANLFVFIIAPAASGKGSLTFAKVLGDKFHDKLVAESTEKLKIHKIELQEYKRKINDKKKSKTD